MKCDPGFVNVKVGDKIEQRKIIGYWRVKDLDSPYCHNDYLPMVKLEEGEEIRFTAAGKPSIKKKK